MSSKISLIYSSDIDYANDFLDISVELIREQSESNFEIVKSRINVKNLKRDREQEEYWNIGSLGAIRVKYRIKPDKEDRVKTVKDEKSAFGPTNMHEENPYYIFYDHKGKDEGFKDDKGLADEIINQFQKCVIGNVSINSKESAGIKYKNFIKIDVPKDTDGKHDGFKSRGVNKLPFILSSDTEVSTRSRPSISKPNVLQNTSDYDLSNCLSSRKNLNKENRSDTFSESSQIVNNNIIFLENQVLEISKHFLESFCEAFFVAGVSNKNAVKINQSESYISPCNHKKCSILPAYKPEILQRFAMGELYDKEGKMQISTNKFQSGKFDLSGASSSLCFPQGIKLCYNQNESEIKPMKNFMTVTTNEYGTRHYIYVHHFYLKTDCITFKKFYEFDPVKEYFHQIIFSNTDNINLNKKQSEKIEKNLELFTEFINCDYIYIPQCICLVSKIPFTKQLEKCAETILKMSVDTSFKSSDLSKFLLHLIYEIPIPPPNKRLLFYLPYQTSPTEITGSLFKDLPIFSSNSTILLDFFPAEAIVTIYNMILLEQKLLFIHDDYDTLTKISQAFINIMYPIQWISTYIPVLSEEMTKYVQLSFMPYIMGIDETLLKLHARNYFDDDNCIYLIFIKKGIITTSIDYCKNKSSSSLKSITKNLPQLPDEVQEELVKEIKQIQITKGKDKKYMSNLDKKTSEYYSAHNSFNNSGYNSNVSSAGAAGAKLEKQFRNLFIKAMVTLYGDYRNYTSLVRENVPCFTSDIFLLNRPEKYSKFFNEFIQTGNFKNFLRLPRENFPYFEKMCKRYNNTIMNRNKKKLKTLIMSESKKRSTVKFIRNDSNLKTIKEMNPLGNLYNRGSTLKFNNSEMRDDSINIFSQESNTKTDEFPKNKEFARTPVKTVTSAIRFKSIYDGSSESISNVENFNKSQENVESFLVTPFFIKNPIIKSDVSKIEDFLHEKFKYANNASCDNERLDTENSKNKSRNYIRCNKCNKCRFDFITENGIVSNAKEFFVDKISEMFETFNRYIIPGNEKDINNFSTNERKSSGITAYASNIASYMTNHSGETEKSNIENMINTIDEYLRSILSSDPLSLNDKTNFQAILNTKYGRHWFSEILYQKKFKDNVSQILNDKGFDDLSQIIFSSLLLGENEQSQFDDMIKITKSCFYYYK